MTPPTKIKVSRVALLERLQQVAQEEESNYLMTDEAYSDEITAFEEKLAEALRQLANQVITQGVPDTIRPGYRGKLDISIYDLAIPEKPTPPGPNLGKLIRTLELSTEDTITVSASDTYYQYL